MIGLLSSEPFFWIDKNVCTPGGEKMVRFIHAADLHLDTPFHGLKEISEELSDIMQEAPFQSFRKIVDKAIEETVDFVLLSGDLYNTQKINIKAQSIFIHELMRLEQEKIPVFLIRGNHDFLTDETEKLTLKLPENVFRYSEEVTSHVIATKTGEKVAVSAFSYERQWIRERKIQDYPERFEDVDMHIGMLHGAPDSINSSNGNYAPFSLAELKQKNYDYWALGHIHQRQQLSSHPLAFYPGNIQALHRNEKGEKGCLLIEWTNRGSEIEFIATAPIVWEEITIELATIHNINQLIRRIKEELMEKEFIENYLIHLNVQVNSDDDVKLIELLQKDSFIEDLTNQLSLPNLWIADIEIQVNKIDEQRNLEELYPEEWKKSIEDIKERAVFSELTEDILNNIPSRYLGESNTQEYREHMIKKAVSKIYLK